jgi:SAM-dependent methyltransferase
MELTKDLQRQELSRIRYWKDRDYFLPWRLKWRAQMVRHLFHLFPGESILEVGSSQCEWTREISSANNHSNPICAVTFDADSYQKVQQEGVSENIEHLLLEDFPGGLEGRQFDFIVAWDLLTDNNCGLFISHLKKLLKPGGELLVFERNPWNPYYNLRHFLFKVLPFLKKRDEAVSINRVDLFTILSEIGFVRIKILPYDFLFPPIPKFFLWPMQNLSLILENSPYVRNFAGSLFLWGRNPAPENWKRPLVNLVRHDRFKGKVSIVVPCRNEEQNIPALIENLKGCYDEYIHEVILVDDNSSDRTAEIGERIGREDPRIRVIRRSMPNGVGRALRDGFAAVTGNYVLMMDCDFQHILPEISLLFDAMNSEDADVIIGSRFSRESVLLNYAFTKILSNRGFHIIANIVLGKHFRDATNNLKLMKREVVENLHLEFDDFAANAETGLQPILLGYQVQEVPISWINRSVDMGFSNFNLMKTGPNYIRVLFRLMTRKWFGRSIVRRSLREETSI